MMPDKLPSVKARPVIKVLKAVGFQRIKQDAGLTVEEFVGLL
jgi:predicted RNA binding protein YcfA (HicA-like mRNA interferase family)